MLEPSWLYLYRREYYLENEFEFRKGLFHEDFGLTPLCIVCAKSVVSTDIYGYYYLLRDNSITTNTDYEKNKKRAYDLLEHYDRMIEELNSHDISEISKENVKIFLTNCIILKVDDLEKKDIKKYIQEIRKRKLANNIKARNFKQLIKKIILKLNIKLYLKLR